jgi:hypothetical protein
VTSQVPIDGADSDEVETVHYVSNIYEYYVAYKLIAVQKQQRQKAKEALENTTTPRLLLANALTGEVRTGPNTNCFRALF